MQHDEKTILALVTEPANDLAAFRLLDQNIKVTIGHILRIEERFERLLDELRQTRALAEQYEDRARFYIERKDHLNDT